MALAFRRIFVSEDIEKALQHSGNGAPVRISAREEESICAFTIDVFSPAEDTPDTYLTSGVIVYKNGSRRPYCGTIHAGNKRGWAVIEVPDDPFMLSVPPSAGAH